MRTITLELLRHGPAHNQLLSPLTQYLALCENHSAVTVDVPFEHNQFLHRLRALSYRLEEEPRQFQVRDTAARLGEILGKVPGLTADVNRRQRGLGAESVAHLRLVLSASELALLPFELALAPDGFPGAGQQLLLQSQLPFCITRETRRVSEDFVVWPKRPRVLLVAAAPPGYAAVPLAAHLLALRKALEPWIDVTQQQDAETRQVRVARHLTVLTEASADAIEAACASGKFTHVHILAHGQEYQIGYDVRFGLALHGKDDAVDIVSGERLATALRATAKGTSGELCRPAVVTVASCEGGNVGTVAGAGASVAHALHDAGIPMVIASQFPLSYGASVRMVEVLYGGLLWGEDPRNLMVDLRRQLHTQFPTTHDWASLVAYASLPPDFESQLADVQISRADASIDVALKAADEATARFSDRVRSRTTSATDDDNEAALGASKARLETAQQRLGRLKLRRPEHSAGIDARLASMEKRVAENAYSFSKISRLDQKDRTAALEDAFTAMERARGHYWSAFLGDRTEYWMLIQFLSLTLILRSTSRPLPPDRPEQEPAALWTSAYVPSLADLRASAGEQRGWAHAALLELYILAPLIPNHAMAADPNALRERVITEARELVAVSGPKSLVNFSTRRQIARYLEWYPSLAPAIAAPISALAEAAFGCLPECEEPEHV